MSGGEAGPSTAAGLSEAGQRRVLVVLCGTEIVSWGVLYYAFPVLGPSIADDTGWSIAALTAAFSAGLVVNALVGILDGSAIGIDYPQFRRAAVHKAHLSIYEAIASRDPDASAEAMSRHIQEYVRYAEKKFPDVLDAPIVWSS